MADEDGGLGKADIAGIAAAASAAIGVVASLAVTGVLGEAQRNHGIALMVAFALVLFGAGLWVLGVLIASALRSWHARRRTGRFIKSNGGTVLQVVAVLLFIAGLILAIVAIVRTQGDSERPAVSATFNRKTRILSADVSGHGLASDHRLMVRVRGMREQRRHGQYVLSPAGRYLYMAAVGPNGNGVVKHAIRVFVPTEYALVQVKAWSGTETRCELEETRVVIGVPENLKPGCLNLRLPP